MSQKIDKAITRGLLAGYGGKTKFVSIQRGTFELKSSRFADDGIEYIDQWLPEDTGGGQELVRAGGEKFTRLYAGGLVKPERLKELGITGKDVIQFLIKQISFLGEKTRLFADCHPDTQDNWKYDYQLVESENEVGVSVGKETIKYKNNLVFVYYLLLGEVR